MSASTIGAAVGFVVGGPAAPFTAALGFQAGAQKENLDEVRRTRKAQERLEDERRTQLRNEAAAREAAAAKAATSGQRVGRASIFAQGLGFGSGNTAQGLGSGTLFGN